MSQKFPPEMVSLERLFENNLRWANEVECQTPGFFRGLVAQQAPEYLWIGCADSRVPANEVVGLQPGELFVHRNVANLVLHADLNCLSVLQYAVDVLKIRHVMIVGHYGCGGIRAALDGERHGLIDNWLRPIQELFRKYEQELKNVPKSAQLNVMCEINAICQAVNLAETTVVQDAWQRNQNLFVHGFVYSLEDGLLRDLGVNICAKDNIYEIANVAISQVIQKKSIL